MLVSDVEPVKEQDRNVPRYRMAMVEDAVLRACNAACVVGLESFDAGAIYAGHAAQEPTLVRSMGRASCDYGLTTVYKVFFKIGSPEFIIGRAARVFSSYYDTGELCILETRPGRCLAELRGFEGGAPQFCERIFGWMQRTLELAGAKNLRPRHDVCVHRGGAVCRFEGDWDA